MCVCVCGHYGDCYLHFQSEDQYILKVRGQDLNGNAGGLIGTGTVTIDILDVNDNLPTLDKDEVFFSHTLKDMY